MAKLKVVQYGCGKMGKYTVRYCVERGMEIIGAFDIDEAKIGKDIGELADIGKLNVAVEGCADVVGRLKALQPDVVIITTMSLLSDCEEALLACATAGVNAITTCEEGYFPQNSNPKLFEKIDQLAKENKCSITGTGYQDVLWGNLIITLAGATQRITKIKGSSSYNVEDYGLALAKAHGAGLTVDEFNTQIAANDNITPEARQKLIDEGRFLPSYMWNVNGWLASKLGLTVVSQTQKCVPLTADKELDSTTLGMKIPAGNATGMSAVVTTKTKEGIEIEAECIGKVYTSDEFDKNEWTIEGEPNTTVTISRPSTVELTCATLVNRIPDLMTAPAGYITTDNFTIAKFNPKQK